jgi:hypothetical protein
MVPTLQYLALLALLVVLPLLKEHQQLVVHLVLLKVPLKETVTLAETVARLVAVAVVLEGKVLAILAVALVALEELRETMVPLALLVMLLGLQGELVVKKVQVLLAQEAVVAQQVLMVQVIQVVKVLAAALAQQVRVLVEQDNFLLVQEALLVLLVVMEPQVLAVAEAVVAGLPNTTAQQM